MVRIKDLPDKAIMTPGHTACAGCGVAIAIRNMMKVIGENSVVYNPACCLMIFTAMYPKFGWTIPYHHVAFENSAACATGIKRAYSKLGKDDVKVVAIAGDGGTADIGIQALSGAAERNEDIIYIMYDNEAYMNTGIQRSGCTPYGAWTTTTPVGKVKAGKKEHKKDMPMIVHAHNVPYVATASVGYMADLLKKVEKARDIKGFRYIQVFTPCPTGWRSDTAKTVELAKMAVDCGMYTLFEAEKGKIRITKKPKMTPVRDYLMMQGRFRHLKEEDVEELQRWVNEKWRRDEALAKFYEEFYK
ncbi:MAG TPA: pyruvate synthase subunit beta [Euryarchaeota archaeon]|nr:pyruvate synthase subunit beta [Euryarchaeota archaeon]